MIMYSDVSDEDDLSEDATPEERAATAAFESALGALVVETRLLREQQQTATLDRPLEERVKAARAEVDIARDALSKHSWLLETLRPATSLLHAAWSAVFGQTPVVTPEKLLVENANKAMFDMNNLTVEDLLKHNILAFFEGTGPADNVLFRGLAPKMGDGPGASLMNSLDSSGHVNPGMGGASVDAVAMLLGRLLPCCKGVYLLNVMGRHHFSEDTTDKFADAEKILGGIMPEFCEALKNQTEMIVNELEITTVIATDDYFLQASLDGQTVTREMWYRPLTSASSDAHFIRIHHPGRWLPNRAAFHVAGGEGTLGRIVAAIVLILGFSSDGDDASLREQTQKLQDKLELSPDQIQDLIAKNPFLLVISLDQFEATLSTLEAELGLTLDEVLELVKGSPSLLCVDPKKLKATIKTLVEKFGLTLDEAVVLVKGSPSLVRVDSEKLEAALKTLEAEMGLSPDQARWLVQSAPSLFTGGNPGKLGAALKTLKENFCLTMDEAVVLVKESPLLVHVDSEKLEAAFKTLKEEMGLRPDQARGLVLSAPSLFTGGNPGKLGATIKTLVEKFGLTLDEALELVKESPSLVRVDSEKLEAALKTLIGKVGLTMDKARWLVLSAPSLFTGGNLEKLEAAFSTLIGKAGLTLDEAVVHVKWLPSLVRVDFEKLGAVFSTLEAEFGLRPDKARWLVLSAPSLLIGGNLEKLEAAFSTLIGKVSLTLDQALEIVKESPSLVRVDSDKLEEMGRLHKTRLLEAMERKDAPQAFSVHGLARAAAVAAAKGRSVLCPSRANDVVTVPVNAQRSFLVDGVPRPLSLEEPPLLALYNEIINFDRPNTRRTNFGWCVMCGCLASGEQPTYSISLQNKGVCTSCASVIWKHDASSEYYKFCKRCKNFLHVHAFANKLSKCAPHTKYSKPPSTCDRCLERVRLLKSKPPAEVEQN